MKEIENIVDRIFKLETELNEKDSSNYSFEGKTVVFVFSWWNYTANEVSFNVFESEDGVFILIRYGAALEGYFKTMGGEVWTSDRDELCTNRRKAGLKEVVEFFDAILGQQVITIEMIFDGQMQVEKDTNLHLRFDHPSLNRTIFIQKALVCRNPLTVIDQLQ
jgi:hypothetical protein